MKKILTLLVMFFIITSCSKSIRFTDDEIREFPPAIQNYIRNGEIATGMTLLYVRYSWGPPHIVNVIPPTKDGLERVEWIYEKFGFFKTILRFTDKKLTEIISTEPGMIK